VTFLTAAGNIPRVKGMLASAADTVDIVPLKLPQVPGLPAEAASTAELSAAGAELLKAAVDGTRPQVAALLSQLRPDAVMFDFAVPWVCGLAAPLGIKTLRFSVFSAVSDAFLVVTARRLQAHGSSKSDLA
jgi:flavonol-3-O-glucoside L-rhamnosyltransferase